MSLTQASWLLVCLAVCHGHAVVPVVPAVPAVHAYHGLAPYPVVHHGYGLLGHGLLAKPLGHHLWKRSPHYVEPLAHLAHVAHVAPVAVSHQSRLDLHTAPVVAPVALVKPLVAPVLPLPVAHKALVSPLHYGAGLHGLYPHVGHY